MGFDWMIAFTMLLEFLQECMENRSRADIEAGIRNPGLREVMALRYVLRRKFGLRGRELRDAVKEGVEYGREISDRVLTDMLDEAAAIKVVATDA